MMVKILQDLTAEGASNINADELRVINKILENELNTKVVF